MPRTNINVDGALGTVEGIAYQIGDFVAADAVGLMFLRVQSPPSGGACIVELWDGTRVLSTVTIPDGTAAVQQDVADSVDSDGPLYVRVTQGSGAFTLSGWVDSEPFGFVPGPEPITLANAKAFLRVDHSADDALIGEMIAAARGYAEDYTKSSLVTRSRVLTLNDWPESRLNDVWWSGVRQGAMSQLVSSSEVRLPYGPINAVTKVASVDEADVETVMTPGDYWVDKENDLLQPMPGVSWPRPGRATSGIRIEYDTEPPAVIETSLQLGIKQHVAAMYEFRTTGDIANIRWRAVEAPSTSIALYVPRRRVWL